MRGRLVCELVRSRDEKKTTLVCSVGNDFTSEDHAAWCCVADRSVRLRAGRSDITLNSVIILLHHKSALLIESDHSRV